jgi:hypothetical protein
MKTTILTIAIIFATIIANSQVTRGMYGFKSGHVEYELTGNTTGTKSLWWDDYGAKSCTETNSVTKIEMFGVSNETKMHTISVIEGDKYWFVDLSTNTGQEGDLSAYGLYDDYENMTDAEKQQMADEMLNELGGEKQGTEKVLGCDCEIIYLLGSKAWNCKGVLLKSETETMGVSAFENATLFEKNIAVPASKFIKPAGVNFSEAEDYMKLLDQMMMEGEDDESESED